MLEERAKKNYLTEGQSFTSAAPEILFIQYLYSINCPRIYRFILVLQLILFTLYEGRFIGNDGGISSIAPEARRRWFFESQTSHRPAFD